MAKEKKSNYFIKNYKQVKREDIEQALLDAEEKFIEIKKKFEVDKDTLSFRAGKQ